MIFPLIKKYMYISFKELFFLLIKLLALFFWIYKSIIIQEDGTDFENFQQSLKFLKFNPADLLER